MKLHPETLAIRLKQEKTNREHSVPIYMTSSFTFDDAEQARAMFADEVQGNIYTRFSNPNTNEFVDKMVALEEAEDGIATASGMSAIFTGMAGLLNSGDHIVASRSVFGSTHQILTKILPKWGISHTYVDGIGIKEWEEAIQPNTKMFFLETPSNPGLQLIDLEAVGKLANEKNIILNVDNCFATPIIQKPYLFGAHLVTHSATKFIDGQGRAIGGIVVGRADLIKELRFFARQTGPSLSPFNAWIFSKSLETLAIRMKRHSKSAFELAHRLQELTEIEHVRYPFLGTHPQFDLAQKQMQMGGGIICIEVKGGVEKAVSMIDKLLLLSITANLGDSRTIVTHPATTTHSKLSKEERLAVGITDNLIRISVGLEHPDDIYNDIVQALTA
ncbi:aminotransferase class I/II-fold pyridoxal phosphate-dependent enzyme [bacterium]|nr:MAG: aminotransferase class I/II-fold pyridoxal phosphate-dependent enzyme [bacterium]